MSTTSSDPYSAPYWQGLRERKVLLPRCQDCGRATLPAGPCCPNCLSERLQWEAASGRGRVVAYAEYHHAFDPALADTLPYNVALVQLEEGPSLITNIVCDDISEITNDMPVRACFVDVGEETILRFMAEF